MSVADYLTPVCQPVSFDDVENLTEEIDGKLFEQASFLVIGPIGIPHQVEECEKSLGRFEEEEVGWLAASIEGGLEVNAPNTGTLGGFLKDQHGDTYGVTCGHVATAEGRPSHLLTLQA